MDSDYNIYKTLNFKSFQKIRITDKIINTEILNNLFYWLDDYFLINYQIWKWMNWLRNYSLVSYKLLVIYYAIWLYVKDLTKSLSEEKNKLYIKNIVKSFYWTHINSNFLSENKIAEIHYLNNYKEFLKEFEKQIKFEEGISKILIELDIKDYYDSINIEILLNNIEIYSTPSKIKELKYDQNTKNVIKDFLYYLQPFWIIQSDNNIISSFLWDLYLSELDLFIYDLFGSKKDVEIKVLRYIDDIKIIV